MAVTSKSDMLATVLVAGMLACCGSAFGAPGKQVEKLDRGVVAIHTGAGNFVGWRALGTDAPGLTFDVYRNGRKLNAQPLAITNFMDGGAPPDARYAVRAAGTPDAGSAPAQGLPALRRQIARYLGAHRGIACTPDDVIVTTGIRHALDLFARVTLRPGATVLVEDPCYPGARQLFALAGAEVVDVPVDRDGIDTDALTAHAGAAAVYVTPAHQSPLGVTLTPARRRALLDWAHATDAWIVEDDYDGEFSYLAAPLPALKALDAHGRVVYCGSFNKSLFSGLRIGFMVAPPALRAALAALLQLTGRAAGLHEQRALAGFIEAGDFARHLRTSRQAYLQRRDAILDQLRRHAPGRWAATGEHAGFHFVLWLAPDADAADLARRGAALGLRLQPLGALCRTVRLPPALVIGYTALTPAQARHAGRLLAQLLAPAPNAVP